MKSWRTGGVLAALALTFTTAGTGTAEARCFTGVQAHPAIESVCDMRDALLANVDGVSPTLILENLEETIDEAYAVPKPVVKTAVCPLPGGDEVVFYLYEESC